MLLGVWDRDGILAQALRQVTIVADRVQDISLSLRDQKDARLLVKNS